MQSFVRRLSLVLALVSGVLLCAVMGIMVVDVVGRYGFASPLTFAVELVQLLMGLVITFGFALTTLNRGHIRVDIVTQLSPRPVRALLDWIADATTLVVFGLIAWKLFEKAAQTLSDGIFTQILGLPVYPVVYLMAAACGAALFVAGVLLLKPSAGGMK